MIQEASEKISDNTREANKKRILEHIKKAGKEGITEGRIADRCGSIDKRQRSEIIEDLRLGCRIAAKTVAPVTGRPRTRWYFEG
jgi:chromosome segregation and condensation protein ScpB